MSFCRGDLERWPEVMRSLDGLGPLYELSAALATTATAEQVAARAMETLLAQLDGDDAWVVECDPRADGFAVLDQVGAGAAVVDLLQAPTDPVAGEMLRTVEGGWPMWLADRAAVEAQLPAFAAALPHVVSAVVLPLRAPAQADVLGAIGLIFDRPRPTGDERQALLVAVGELAGQALHWQQLRRAELTARQKAAAAIERSYRVADLTAALVGTVGVAEVAAVLAEHLGRALDCQTFSLREIDRKRAVARAIGLGGVGVDYRDRFPDVALDAPSALAEVAATGRAVFVQSAADNRGRYGVEGVERYLAARIEGMARLPLLVEDELVAILSVGYWTAQEFPPEDRRFLTTVADLAAQTLGRAMRTERLNRATDRAQRVNRLAAALAAAVAVADVGAVLAQHVQNAVGCDAFSLRAVDPGTGVARALHIGGAAIKYRERFAEVALDAPSALAEAVAGALPVFVYSAAEARERYGAAAAESYEASQVEAMARLPLLVEGELVAVLSVGYWDPREFDEPDRLFLTTVADLAAQALGRAARTERLRAESRRHRLLSAAQAAINRRLNPLDQLRALANSVVPELADLSTVHVLATPVPPGIAPPLPVIADRVASQCVPGVEPAPLQTGIPWYAGDPIIETIRSGRLLAHPVPPNASPAWAERSGTVETFRAGLHHVVLAPVLVDGLVVAIACFGMCNDRPPWDAEDLSIVETIAGHAATALEHGLDYQHTRETALVLQRRMLGDPPTIEGLQIAVRYQPAGREEVGGDWYDAVEIGPGRVALAVGDVVGHDIHAAAAMGQLRAALRTLSLDEFFEPGAVLQNLGQVNDSLQAAAFATALFARLARTVDGWELTWAAAGHPPPLLIEPDGRAYILDQAAGGVALVPGLDLPRPSARIGLQAGSTVLLYTDGLVERRGVDIGESIAELAADAGALADRPLDELCDTLLQRAAGHDDAALLAVRIDDPA